MFSQLGKDIYHVQQRILDHRIFLAGEIESFRNNLETKRNDKEVELLFKCTETIGEIKYNLPELYLSLAQSRLQSLGDELNSVHAHVQEFSEKAKLEKPASAQLIKSRCEREERRKDFLKDLDYAYQRISNSFEEKEEEINDLYTDLQIKLNIPK